MAGIRRVNDCCFSDLNTCAAHPEFRCGIAGDGRQMENPA
jgi:hypothetical protein